jgi:hypothetical protein
MPKNIISLSGIPALKGGEDVKLSIKDLTKNTNIADIPNDHQANLSNLTAKLVKLEEDYVKSFVVTSGYRSMEKHLAIYAKKGVTDQKKIPMKSNHLFGNACDIQDKKGELQSWVLKNIDLVCAVPFWMEDFSKTVGWVHFQIVPFKSFVSGKTKSHFFVP